MNKLPVYYLLLLLTWLLPSPAFSQVIIPFGATVNLPNVINLSCVDLDVQGTLLLDGSTLAGAQNINIGSSGRIEAGSSNISLSGNWSNSGIYAPASNTVLISDGCSNSTSIMYGSTRFHNLTLSSATGKNFLLAEGAAIYISGVLDIVGTSGNPVTLGTQTPGSARIILLPGGMISTTNGVILDGIEIADAATEAHQIPFTNNFTLLLIILLIMGVAMIESPNKQKIVGKIQ